VTDQHEIQVLLATYNGAAYLDVQIQSILSQDYSNVTVLARDDGSSDSSLEILRRYSRLYPDRFRVLPARGGQPVGPAQSFALLLQESTADYIAFSDQDDCWRREKLSISMQELQCLEKRSAPELPALVFTDMSVVDEDLQEINPSFWDANRLDPSNSQHFARLLIQNPAAGCTCLMNRATVTRALPIPPQATMHDHWVVLVAASTGVVGFVPIATLAYRQHNTNAIGADMASPSLARRASDSSARIRHWQLSVAQAKSLSRAQSPFTSADAGTTIDALIACSEDLNRVVRVVTYLKYGFFKASLLSRAALLFDLWRSPIYAVTAHQLET